MIWPYLPEINHKINVVLFLLHLLHTFLQAPTAAGDGDGVLVLPDESCVAGAVAPATWAASATCSRVVRKETCSVRVSNTCSRPSLVATTMNDEHGVTARGTGKASPETPTAFDASDVRPDSSPSKLPEISRVQEMSFMAPQDVVVRTSSRVLYMTSWFISIGSIFKFIVLYTIFNE